MDTDYFREKLSELKINSESKYKSILETLIKCEDYEEKLSKKISFCLTEHQQMIKIQNEISTLFDIICNELNLF